MARPYRPATDNQAMPYHQGSRELQDGRDTRRLADRIDERLVHDVITEQDRAFIEARDMFFLATAAPEGHPQCSYKGGDPGFVRVVDEHTLTFPTYDGNGMFLSLGNIRVNPYVGLLFIDFTSERPGRLRVNGRAELSDELDVLVHVDDVFPNCPRYIHRMALVERSHYVPRPEEEPPVPDWKRAGWARDVLPAAD